MLLTSELHHDIYIALVRHAAVGGRPFLGSTKFISTNCSSTSIAVWRLATGWTVRGSYPGGDEIFRTCPERPWGPPSLLYNGYRVFPEGKAAGA
jgi:hypothetical protein